jgi:uncharacterized protein (TIGR03790 family)
VLVNDADAHSVAVADYYMQARGLPPENLIHLDFPLGPVLAPDAFALVQADLDELLGEDIQALALTWTNPYRVGCMSVTTAFALGYDLMWCSQGGGCQETAMSPYYDYETVAPYTDLGMRPTMMLAAVDLPQAMALIDRGIASDGTHPTGDGYMIRTTDVARSVRWPDFVATVSTFDHEGGLDLTYINNASGMGSNLLENTTDVLFYFTGLAQVGGIETNTYLPGAVADHLTSFGGQVPDSGQMSCLRWLEAGATGSYGTVVEPCNFPAKFPNTRIVLPHYFRGQTLVEAYWKSVAWPGEGLFIGEPLARPWDGSTVDYNPNTGVLTIRTTLLGPGIDYVIEGADSADGPWDLVGEGGVAEPTDLEFEIPDAVRPFYRLRAE